MIKIFEKLLNIIYIQPCYFCSSTTDDSLICKKCYSKINFLPADVLKEILGCKVYSSTIYDGIIKTMVRDLKYHHKKKLAKVQAKIMYDYFQKLNFNDNFLIVPVPIHSKRKKERKYNHMDIVGDEFSGLSHFKINKNLLLRIKDTENQYKLNKTERIQNLKNAFIINELENIAKNTNILIIDDITSTGATLFAIIETLQKSGYKNIIALTLATPDIWN